MYGNRVYQVCGFTVDCGEARSEFHRRAPSIDTESISYRLLVQVTFLIDRNGFRLR